MWCHWEGVNTFTGHCIYYLISILFYTIYEETGGVGLSQVILAVIASRELSLTRWHSSFFDPCFRNLNDKKNLTSNGVFLRPFSCTIRVTSQYAMGKSKLSINYVLLKCTFLDVYTLSTFGPVYSLLWVSFIRLYHSYNILNASCADVQ